MPFWHQSQHHFIHLLTSKTLSMILHSTNTFVSFPFWRVSMQPLIFCYKYLLKLNSYSNLQFTFLNYQRKNSLKNQYVVDLISIKLLLLSIKSKMLIPNFIFVSSDIFVPRIVRVCEWIWTRFAYIKLYLLPTSVSL